MKTDTASEPQHGSATTHHAAGQCPMDAILRLLMGPWTTYVVWLLETQGPLRFGELKSRIPGISSKMLTERLRHLEAAGLVSRDYKPSIPPAVTYALTGRGHELKDVLSKINNLALRWQLADSGQARAAE